MSRLRLRVTLTGGEPQAWRTFGVDPRRSLRMLHLTLQTIVAAPGTRENP